MTHRQPQPILECEERAGLGPGLSESLMPRLVESFMLYSAPQIIITSRYSSPALRFHTVKPSIPRRELTGVWGASQYKRSTLCSSPAQKAAMLARKGFLRSHARDGQRR